MAFDFYHPEDQSHMKDTFDQGQGHLSFNLCHGKINNNAALFAVCVKELMTMQPCLVGVCERVNDKTVLFAVCVKELMTTQPCLLCVKELMTTQPCLLCV